MWFLCLCSCLWPCELLMIRCGQECPVAASRLRDTFLNRAGHWPLPCFPAHPFPAPAGRPVQWLALLSHTLKTRATPGRRCHREREVAWIAEDVTAELPCQLWTVYLGTLMCFLFRPLELGSPSLTANPNANGCVGFGGCG